MLPPAPYCLHPVKPAPMPPLSALAAVRRRRPDRLQFLCVLPRRRLLCVLDHLPSPQLSAPSSSFRLLHLASLSLLPLNNEACLPCSGVVQHAILTFAAAASTFFPPQPDLHFLKLNSGYLPKCFELWGLFHLLEHCVSALHTPS